MKFVLVSVLLLCSCGSAVTEVGPNVRCETVKDPCPSNNHVANVLDIFSQYVPGFDTEERLDIFWYDRDTTWNFNGFIAIGFSQPDRNEIHVINDKVLLHELMHVHLYRYRGDADANHATPGGPWTSYTDGLLEIMEDDLPE